MKVQHSIVNNNKLNTVPVVNGQVIYVKDTHDLYFDVDNTRTKATDIIFVGTLQERDAIQSPTPNKVYCVEENNKFYRYENNEWLQLGYEEQVPEIYYWNGTANQSGYDLWTNIFEVNKKLPVLVIWEQHNTTAKGTYSAYISIGELVNNRNVYGNLMTQSINGNGSYHRLYLKQLLTFTYNNGIVTNINSSTFNDVGYLAVNTQYANPYTPQYPGSPATKKYVDDSFNNYVPMRAFPQGVDITHTTTAFLNSIKALNLNTGDMLLGTVQLTDMPDGIITGAEVKIEVYDNNVIYATMTSSNVAPYVWTCNSHSFRGWEAAYRATEAVFDNTGTDLSSTNVEDALVEINDKIGQLNSLIDEINGE